MAVDGKYGKVTLEKGTIGEDEPVFVFRGQDKLLPQVLAFYAQLCASAGSPARHVKTVEGAIDRVVSWQSSHFTKTPSSDGVEGK